LLRPATKPGVFSGSFDLAQDPRQPTGVGDDLPEIRGVLAVGGAHVNLAACGYHRPSTLTPPLCAARMRWEANAPSFGFQSIHVASDAAPRTAAPTSEAAVWACSSAGRPLLPRSGSDCSSHHRRHVQLVPAVVGDRGLRRRAPERW